MGWDAGDAERHEVFAEPARAVEQGKRVAGEDRIEQRLPLQQRGAEQMRRLRSLGFVS
jgi:hypothetical protein